MPKTTQTMLKRSWIAPTVKELSAGDAEANGNSIEDGGGIGNARS